ncbi:hypothetical protein MLD38_007881 [Melastoma candidum]|uniref:Uncharacterized protein n=1 Tax=Melastoma candidum TaxID=119954 RepID=A0ACB9RSH6_9MYRT|nr:hypothetical protein MLD38_007881 [Melastoma candidum]
MDSEEERQQTSTTHKRKREKLTATISVLPDDPEKIPPLVAYFPSGYHPNPNPDSPRSEVRVFRNASKPGRLQLAFRPSSSSVEFVGSSFSGESTAVQGCSYALGVLDKESGVLRVVPIAANRVFRMEPKVPSREADDQQSELAVEELSAQNRYEGIRQLTSIFGTKQSIRRDQMLQSLKLVDDPDAREDLDEKIREVEVNKEALESTSSHVARNVPPHNVSASTPKEAYPLDKIILKGEWDYIGDILQLLEAGEEISPPVYPTFVCNRIQKLRDIEDETEKQTLGSIFSFIMHLIKFKDKHSLDGVSSGKDHKIPSILRQKFSGLFSVAGSKFLPKEKIDLLISYVLVLTLFADDFESNPTDISKDLRMSFVTLRQHFLQLGCKFRRQDNVYVAYLPTPLKFPELRRQRRR